MVLLLTHSLHTTKSQNEQLCALKIAQDELEWDQRSGAFDRIAQEEIKAGRAQDAGIKDPVSSA